MVENDHLEKTEPDCISAKKALFVSTDLSIWATDKPQYLSDDMKIHGKCHRRLDPKYYAWLRYKIMIAKKYKQDGRLNPEAFEHIRIRFNQINQWAKKHYNGETLRLAVNCFEPENYLPPAKIEPYENEFKSSNEDLEANDVLSEEAPSYLYPKDGSWSFTRRVLKSAIEKVDAIKGQAIQMGWQESRLYQNQGRFRFPLGNDYGLICFLDEDDRIGEITYHYIEIIHPSPHGENKLRFNNWDAGQNVKDGQEELK